MQNSVEESLNRFSKSVLDKALDVRKQMEEEMTFKKKELLEHKELEYLEEAYRKIQHGITKLHRESNEYTSKTVIDYKRELILRREQIVNEVFEEVMGKIKNYSQTSEYYNWLIQSAQNVLEMVSVKEGSGILYINATDSRYMEKISTDINNLYSGINIEVKVYEAEDFIGGTKALNPELGIEADNSIKSRIVEARYEFLKTSGLIVD